MIISIEGSYSRRKYFVKSVSSIRFFFSFFLLPLPFFVLPIFVPQDVLTQYREQHGGK